MHHHVTVPDPRSFNHYCRPFKDNHFNRIDMPTTSTSRSVLLVLTSHAHSPPLRPAPHLKYDLRTVPNPPKAIRDAYTGVSKRLRDHMLDHDIFVESLERAEAEIRVEAEKVIEVWTAHNKAERGDSKDDVASDIGVRRTNGRAYNEDDEANEDEDAEGEDEEMVDDRPVLTVGVFCARGQHRSVAFVEELARKSWPKQWDVRVIHRDFGKVRGDGRSKNGRRDRKIRGADMVNDS
jgi:hypothetical protein